MTVFEMIEDQQKGMEDTTVFMVGEQLKDICRADPTCAAIVEEDLQQEAMSIVNCEKKIKAYADEIKTKKKLRAVGVSPAAADQIIRKFYGLPEATSEQAQVPTGEEVANAILDLDQLLGL